MASKYVEFFLKWQNPTDLKVYLRSSHKNDLPDDESNRFERMPYLAHTLKDFMKHPNADWCEDGLNQWFYFYSQKIKEEKQKF